MPAPALSEIRLAADPDRWRDAGFAVTDEHCAVGGVRLEFLAGGGGIVDWALTEVRRAGIDGLATRPGGDARAAQEHASGGEAVAAQEHPNGAFAVDHVVVLTPSLERTIGCFEEAGVELRRVREGETGLGSAKQAFFRLGRPIVEVVERTELGPQAPARFWGLTFATTQLDAAADHLGERLGTIRDAVQPGRRIATFRRDAGLGLPVALITPHPD